MPSYKVAAPAFFIAALSFLGALLVSSFSWAIAPRISSISKDLSRSEIIRMKAGLATVIEFPKPIIEVRVGNTQALKTQISSVSPKELTLFLSASASRPTNLIIRADKKVYVFDIVPSELVHQDYIRIASGYSGPAFQEVTLTTEDEGLLGASPKTKTLGSGPTLEGGNLE